MDQLLGQQHAAGLGDGDGRGAQVLAELSPQLARADAGPGGQRVQVAVVQRAQLDQLQRARHAGGQPRRGAGGGRDFRAAAQAGMEAGLLRGRGRGVEDDIARQGVRAGQTGRQ